MHCTAKFYRNSSEAKFFNYNEICYSDMGKFDWIWQLYRFINFYVQHSMTKFPEQLFVSICAVPNSFHNSIMPLVCGIQLSDINILRFSSMGYVLVNNVCINEFNCKLYSTKTEPIKHLKKHQIFFCTLNQKCIETILSWWMTIGIDLLWIILTLIIYLFCYEKF